MFGTNNAATPANTPELPPLSLDKMSTALGQALDDLEALSKVDGYKVDMGDWISNQTYYSDHTEEDEDEDEDDGENGEEAGREGTEVCEFCLAGATLIRRTDSETLDSACRSGEFNINKLPGNLRRMLFAIDNLRQYRFADAFSDLYFSTYSDESLSSDTDDFGMMLLAISQLQQRFDYGTRFVAYTDSPAQFISNMRAVADILRAHGF